MVGLLQDGLSTMHSANAEGPSSPIPEDDRSSLFPESATGSTNVEEPSSPILDDDHSFDDFITHDDDNLPLSSPQTPAGTRVRVTAQNPAFGFVEGAMRGIQKLGKYVFTVILSACHTLLSVTVSPTHASCMYHPFSL